MKKLLLALILSVCSALPVFAAALTQYCTWSVIATGNTLYGGVFDPSVVSGASGVLANLASTSSSSTTPTFSSASYTFVAGDVGNWVYVAAGASWQVGLYKITGLSGNNAVVDAAIGHVILWSSTTGTWSLSTVAGCGATASGTFVVNNTGPGQTADNVTNATFGDATTANTTLTNTANTFTPVMIGNGVHITAVGTNGVVGWYTILTYIDAKDVTINVTSNSGTTSSGMTGYIGGAVALLDNINSASAGLGPVAGNNLYCGGTFTQANTLTWAPAGTSTSPVLIQGYVTYWGDASSNFSRTNGSGAISTANMPAFNFASTKQFAMASGLFTMYDWLNVSGNQAGAFIALPVSALITRCVLTNASANAAAVVLQPGGAVVFNNDILATGATTATTGVAAANLGTLIAANRIIITSPTGNGITVSGAGPGIIGNQIIGAGKATASAGAGIVTTAAAGHPFIVGNTIVGFYDDINFITGTTVLNSVIGNMLTDSANYGINNVNVSNAVASFYNRTGNNANGAQGTPGVFLALTNYGEVTAWTTSDYTNVASNLILLTGSPAVGKAYFPSASIGALQLSAVAGGEIDSAYVK